MKSKKTSGHDDRAQVHQSTRRNPFMRTGFPEAEHPEPEHNAGNRSECKRRQTNCAATPRPGRLISGRACHHLDLIGSSAD